MTARKTPADVEVLVTVGDKHLKKLPEVAAALEARGLKVAHTLASSGLITGSAPAQALDRLREVAGVAAVERSGSVQIAPPDADVQ